MVNEGFRTTGKRVVEEVPYGVYVWEIIEDGQTKILGDDEGNFLNIFCTKGDRRAIAALADAARHYGHPEGRPVWWTGKRPVTDEEYEEQVTREKLGLVPDPLDAPAIKERLREKHSGY